MSSKSTILLAILVLGAALLFTSYLGAQEDAAAGTQPDIPAQPGTKDMQLTDLLKQGGAIGLLIVLMSVVTVALVVEHFLTINKERLIPSELVENLHNALEAKDVDEARRLCEESPSLLGQTVGAGLEQVGGMFGFFDIQNAIQEVSERYVGRLFRKLSYLTFISATAPMLGLLGTVTGMMSAFNMIAQKGGKANPADLAGGISGALITTCFGLIIAIPAMFFVSIFRNRIDGLVAECEAVIARLMGRFKQPDQT